ncbi:MAG: DUF3656 domain-containing protein [Veillonellales bacterium]
MIELLAPVGSREALIAAVESGADAVYLAGKAFGARAFAPNFDDEELAAGVRFAHLHGVLVHVTVNILVDNSEVPALITYLRYLSEIGVDAIIVQDVGVAEIARQIVPQMILHGSTQMTVHNLAGVQLLAAIGFERVVLSRELSLADIEYICQHTNIEIETFIHGALCISYSGQCLMSSMIGGRSGNRGRCAQPCRLPYTLVDHTGSNVLSQADCGEYLLSPRDLNTLDLLPELINAGVTSFKIEGRMKRPEYVAVVVDIYRRAIDSFLANQKGYAVDEQDNKDLAQIFNRDFTTAYLQKKQGRYMMSDRRPNNRGVRIGRVVTYRQAEKLATIKLDEPLNMEDIIEFWVKVGGRVSVTIHDMYVNGKLAAHAPAGTEVSIPAPIGVRDNDRVFKVFDAKLMERARNFFADSTSIHRIPVTITVQVEEGEPLRITLRDIDGNKGEAATAFIAEKARNRPLTQTTIAKQVERLGNTAFVMEQLDCRISGNVMVPVSEINDARRRAVEALEQSRLKKFFRPLPADTVVRERDILPRPINNKKNSAVTELAVNVDTIPKLQAALENGADILLFGGESFLHRRITAAEYEQAVTETHEQGKKVIFNTPRIVKEWQMPELKEELELFNRLQPDGVSVANLGTLSLAQEQIDLPLHGDYPLNIYNSVSVDFFAKQNISSLTLSPELTFGQVEEIAGRTNMVLECLVHGYITLMVSEYCAMGSYLGQLHTGRCSQPCGKRDFWLKDRKDELFPVAADQYCRMHILNAKELSMLPHVVKFSQLGIQRIRIEGKKSDTAHLAKITQLYRELLDQGNKHPLLVEDKLRMLEHENITRGHYFRGII